MVQLERWEANTSIDLFAPGGLEIFVIQGGFSEGGEVFQPSLPNSPHTLIRVNSLMVAIIWAVHCFSSIAP